MGADQSIPFPAEVFDQILSFIDIKTCGAIPSLSQQCMPSLFFVTPHFGVNVLLTNDVNACCLTSFLFFLLFFLLPFLVLCCFFRFSSLPFFSNIFSAVQKFFEASLYFKAQTELKFGKYFLES